VRASLKEFRLLKRLDTEFVNVAKTGLCDGAVFALHRNNGSVQLDRPIKSRTFGTSG